jgi:hypothetical protein
MRHTGLAVVEARWWKEGNDSVRPLFETVAGITEGNPHAVRYDMFADEGSLARIIGQIATDPTYHSIYIGAHGDENSIVGLDDASISRTKFRNMLIKSNENGIIKGIYFGSCLIGTEKNAAFWLTENSDTNIEWIAGYRESVDWIDSSAIDMIFWSKYLYERKQNKSRKRNKKSDLQILKNSANEMKSLMPSIFTKLGFNIYYVDRSGTINSIW